MIIGLTGGIGSGKSTVARYFTELGINVIDADQVARDVVQPGTFALKEIGNHFGSDILTNSELNRSKLRDIIFRDRKEKTWLESLLHPLIRTEMLDQLNQSESLYSILEAPLLFENNLDSLCRKSVLVDIPENLQIERSALRDDTDSDSIRSIINAQMPRVEKQQRADYILDNSVDLDHIKAQVLRLDQILQLLAKNSEFQ